MGRRVETRSAHDRSRPKHERCSRHREERQATGGQLLNASEERPEAMHAGPRPHNRPARARPRAGRRREESKLLLGQM